MAARIDFDVVIAGGGLVGASLAALLARVTRLRIALLDRGEPVTPPPRPSPGVVPPPFEYGLRVSALSHATWRLIDLVRAHPDPRAVAAYERMEVWEDGGAARDARIEFDCAELGEPSLGYIADNRAVLQAFYEVIHREPQVTLMAPVGLSAMELPTGGGQDSTVLRLDDGRALRTRLVVGADGARSRVRELAGLRVRQHAYDQAGVVAHLASALPHGATARQRFLPDGPLALLPLADGRVSLVWSTLHEHARELLALPAAEFSRVVTDASEGVLGTLELRSERASFPLRLLHAREYTASRVALVGDAAHVVHPLAGQGVNLGFLDAAALAGELERATARGEDIGDHYVLKRYERARKGENLAAIAALDGLKRLFGNRNPLINSIRRSGVAAVHRLGPVKGAFARRAMGLEGDVPRLLAEHLPR